ncbi:MAG TPA: CoA-transferase, partial [Planctomycetaceae bacterium]|nr:CoA-transferase [Planctomycetaceae bacterium]
MTESLQSKLCTAAEAIAAIEDGVTIVCGGFVGAAHPEGLSAAFEQQFLATGHPRDLTLVYAAGQGDGKNRGLNHFGQPGMVKRVIGGHWGLVPKLGKLAIENQIEAYNFPQGVICQLLRDIAAGRPGCLTQIGLGTFIDPANDGGRLNSISRESLIERLEIDGRPWLLYKSFPIQIGIIRATVADVFGNLSMHEEAIVGEVLPIAQAVRNCGGTTIAQVQSVIDTPLPPHQVRVPGCLVDRIVIADPHEHEQTFAEARNPKYFEPLATGDEDDPFSFPDDGQLGLERRLIAARACDELRAGDIANLGIGMPEGIARIAAERNLLHHVMLTLESGPIGGMPAGGLSFGASVHPRAIVDQPAQFDFYDGGGLDFAAIGAAQIDRNGSVNVSRFGTRLAGVGGFVNITQTARRLVFCGTFTSSGLLVAVEAGQVKIVQEGRIRKFVSQV